jgi:putative nucleotidyltransferase with HDIG domain
MRVANLKDTLEGSQLALPVHGDGGRLMLGAGTRLTKRLIRTLKSRGYTRVAIHDPLAGNIEPDDAISLETRVQAEKALDQAVCKLLAGQTPDMKAVAHAIDAIIFDLRENSRLCMGIYSVRSYDHNTYTHSINVCILSISIADSLGWPLAKLRVLGTGALLHDVGKILMPVSILNKPGALTDEEYSLIRTHAQKGYELLSDCFDAGSCTSRSALEHHERLDGSGYPDKLKASQISDLAKITAVADVYDAMTTDRPHRKAIFPEAVYAHMIQKRDVLFDGVLVDSLFSKVALYPTGTILSLWGGYIAVVTRQDPRSNFRPFARIVGGPGITRPIDISLYERQDIKVNLLLDDYPPDTKHMVSTHLGGALFDSTT